MSKVVHSRMRQLRLYGALIATVSLSLIVSGCSSDSPSEQSVVDGKPAYGGSITIAPNQEVKGLDPLFGDSEGVDRDVWGLFYEPLIRIDREGEIEPVLAESYEVSADVMSINFTLREGVTFHDGTPWNAEAAAWNLNRVLDPDSTSAVASAVSNIAEVKVVDEMTLELALKSPDASILAALSSQAGFMVSPQAIAEGGDQALQRNAVGTGPFLFVEYKNGVDVVGEKNPSYWRVDAEGEKLPYLDEVIVRFIPEQTVRLTELRTGGVQVAADLPLRDVANLESTGDFVIDNATGLIHYATFNTTRPPFDDPRVRRAVSMAIDREALVAALTEGQGEVFPVFHSPGTTAFGADAVPPVTQDIPEAQRLLSEADQSNLEFEFLVINQGTAGITAAEIIQSNLAEAGVKVSIVAIERQAWIENVRAFEYDFAALRINTPRLDPALSLDPTFGKDGGNNWPGVEDEELAEYLESAKATADPAERRTEYIKAQEAILDSAYIASLYYAPAPVGYTKKLHGFETDVTGNWLLEAAYLE